MAFAHSKNSKVFLNEFSQTAQITGYSVQGSRAYGECTTLADSGNKYVPGLRNGSMTVNGNFNSDAGALDVEFQAAMGTDNSALWTVCPDGTSVGDRAMLTVTDPTSYSIDASVAETVTVTLESQPDDGVDYGVVLHDHAAETSSTDGSSVDHGESSANGGVANLHVTAVSGTSPSLTVKVQHSADDSVWADLITFTAATAATSERQTVSGTVNQYTRCSSTISGTNPSFTYTLAFARR